MSGNNYLDARTRRQINELLQELIKEGRFVSLQSLNNTIFRTAPRDMSGDIMDFLSIRYGSKLKDLPDNRFERLEGKVDIIYNEVKDIKSLLYSKEDKKEEAILEFKKLASEIEDVLCVYCQYTSEGVSLWTMINPTNISEALSNVVRVQIEMENKYDIHFRFLIDPLMKEDYLDTSKWNPLYRRE